MLLNTLLSWRCGWLGVYAMWTDLLVFKGLPVVHAKEAINKTSLHPKHCVSLISSYLDLTHTHTKEWVHVQSHWTCNTFSMIYSPPRVHKHVVHSASWEGPVRQWGNTMYSTYTLFVLPMFHVCRQIICHPLTFTMTTGIYMKTWLSTCCIRNMYNRSQDI